MLEQFVEIESGKHDDRPALRKATRRCLLTVATHGTTAAAEECNAG